MSTVVLNTDALFFFIMFTVYASTLIYIFVLISGV